MSPADPLKKECPYCRETIYAEAIICKHCNFDLTAKYEPCSDCGELIKSIATICRHCNSKKVTSEKSKNSENTMTGSGKQSKFCGTAQQTKHKSRFKFAKEAGSYGEGVRDQVFEVIVRQGMAGAPWRMICAGPMQVNNISEEEVQAEIKRRQNLQGLN
jgi:hypothetical protein